MRAQFVDGGKPHHALGHLRLDRAVGVERIGHAVDNARFEHRDRRLLPRAARWVDVRRGTGRLLSSLGVREGAPGPPRRSAGLARSGFGQASSKVAGGGSPGSGAGGAAGGLGADPAAADRASEARWCATRARSRSFREVEENSRLRRFGVGEVSPAPPAWRTAAVRRAAVARGCLLMPGRRLPRPHGDGRCAGRALDRG